MCVPIFSILQVQYRKHGTKERKIKMRQLAFQSIITDFLINKRQGCCNLLNSLNFPNQHGCNSCIPSRFRKSSTFGRFFWDSVTIQYTVHISNCEAQNGTSKNGAPHQRYVLHNGTCNKTVCVTQRYMLQMVQLLNGTVTKRYSY